jgi:hypothetical protein
MKEALTLNGRESETEKISADLVAAVEYTFSTSSPKEITMLAGNRLMKIEGAKTTELPDGYNTLYYMIRDYANSCGIKLNLRQAAKYGQLASAYCKANGISTGRIPNSRFGTLKTYPNRY